MDDSELNGVLAEWPGDQPDLKRFFLEIIEEVRKIDSAECGIVSRSGISHSFRAAVRRDGRLRPVFFLTDVVPAVYDPWFLSVCFYEDEITDPEEFGNAIPQGLFDETGYCFDVDEYDPELLEYLKARLAEAFTSAAG